MHILLKKNTLYHYSVYICIVKNKKVALIILDGWGCGSKNNTDATAHAATPFFNNLLKMYPHSKLSASGEDVGLPDGQMGNSEVGHMNLGAGRVVYQELGRINKTIKDGALAQNPTLAAAFQKAKSENKKVHFIGLVSDGGVHAHVDHLIALCKAASDEGLSHIYVHAFLDGRDTDPKSGLKFIEKLQKETENTPTQIASIIGRYYAMDRDNRWERVSEAYHLMVNGKGTPAHSATEAIQKSYQEDITDEFMKPIIMVDAHEKPIAIIAEGDMVICFNFRTDRGREITQALTQQAYEAYEMKPLNLDYITFTSYDEKFKNVSVVFQKEDLSATLGEVLCAHQKNQIRIAETEKYPHVTFFFSGGREKEFENEKRILIPSPKVATYDLQPEMSAQEITDAICPELEKQWADFICLNFANPDMVGHTGVFEAVIKAVETADKCAQQVVECGLKNGYSFIILADHGNAEFMLNADGSPNTAHTTNLVPCILIDADYKTIADGKLGDIAPTILKMLNVPIPTEMTGNCLI